MEYSYLNNIVITLDSVEEPGFYAIGGVFQLSPPSLSINISPGSILGLPLCDCHIKSIISSASQAPIGRGEDTIDTSARSTRQLDPTQFSINNLEWSRQIKLLLDKVKADLGCDSRMSVSCELYKLLLYEPGGFFKRHQDTERSEGTFGTLVIQLPSNFSGGQLVVYHQSKHVEFDFGGPAGANNFHYAAFYADCQHEVKPVTKGYRLCLVYNLMYSGSSERPTPANNQELISDIVHSMREWNDAEPCPLMMTYLLRGRDRAVKDILVQANNEVNFDLYHGIVNLEQNWTAREGHPYRDDQDYFIEEFIDEEVSVESVQSCICSGVSISSIGIDKEYIFPEGAFWDADPDEEVFEDEEAVTQQYSWEALLIWPSKNRRDVIGDNNMIRLLEHDLRSTAITPDRRMELESMAKFVLCSDSFQYHYAAEQCVSFLQSLETFGKLELIQQFLELVNSSKPIHSRLVGNPLFSSEILTIGRKYGWDPLRPHLQAIFDKSSSSDHEIGGYFRFVHELMSKDRKDMCDGFATAIISALSKGSGSNVKTCDRKAYLLFLKVLLSLDKKELVLRFLKVLAPSEIIHHALIESRSFSHSFSHEILSICQKYTWSALKSSLRVMFDQMAFSSTEIEKYCKFLYEISAGQQSEEQKVVCRELAAVVIDRFSKESGTLSAYEPVAFTAFLKCLKRLSDYELITRFLKVLGSRSSHYPVLSILAPVCENLYKFLPEGQRQRAPFKCLLSYCITSLKTVCPKEVDQNQKEATLSQLEALVGGSSSDSEPAVKRLKRARRTN